MLEILKIRYERNFIRVDQLRSYVEFGIITEKEFSTITSIQC